MRAFVSHDSACESLRFLSAKGALPAEGWPHAPQRLPADDCLSAQRAYARLRDEADLGAWGIRNEPAHFLVPSQQMRSAGRRACFHVWSSELPSGAFRVLGEGLLVSAPEFVIMQLCGATARLEGLLDAHVAAVRAETEVLRELGVDEPVAVDHPLVREHERRIVDAAVLACEFAGTYRLCASGSAPCYHVLPIMSAKSLAAMADAVGSSTAASRARTVAEFAFDGAASPMETALALLLCLPVDYGGFGLPRPQLNAGIDVSSCRGRLSDVGLVTPDFLWEEQRVALEYDSTEFHVAGAGDRGRDAVRANTLTAVGYRVFRATPRVVGSLYGLGLLARQLAAALGVSLKEPNEVQSLRRQRLYAQLMPHGGA